jgi:hypothetical protein
MARYIPPPVRCFGKRLDLLGQMQGVFTANQSSNESLSLLHPLIEGSPETNSMVDGENMDKHKPAS